LRSKGILYRGKKFHFFEQIQKNSGAAWYYAFAALPAKGILPDEVDKNPGGNYFITEFSTKQGPVYPGPNAKYFFLVVYRRQKGLIINQFLYAQTLNYLAFDVNLMSGMSEILISSPS
jgi:hypothetical protein